MCDLIRTNLDVGNSVDHDAEDALPRVHIIGRNSLRGEDISQITSERLEEVTLDIAGLVGVSHVLNLANDLQGVVHGGDHVVQTVSEHLHLSVEGGVAQETVDGNIGESAEFLLGARRLLEDPTKLHFMLSLKLNFKRHFT